MSPGAASSAALGSVSSALELSGLKGPAQLGKSVCPSELGFLDGRLKLFILVHESWP